MKNFIFNSQTMLFIEVQGWIHTELVLIDSPNDYKLKHSDAYIVDKNTHEILGILSTKFVDFDPRTADRQLRPVEATTKYYPGGIVHLDTLNVSLITQTLPKSYETWKGRGYTGGHMSQSYWDTDQHHREAYNLVLQGYRVVNETTQGNTGGYYPRLLFWKEYSDILKEISLMPSWKGVVPENLSPSEMKEIKNAKKMANIRKFTDVKNNLTLLRLA